MTEITPARLSELRAVAEAATEGPWEADCCPVANMVYSNQGSIGVDATEGDANHIAAFDPPTVIALLDALEAKTAEVEAAERQLAIRAEDSIARRLAMATVAEVGTETAAGDTADTLAELLIEAERERDEARAEASRIEGRAVEFSRRAEKAERERDEARVEATELRRTRLCENHFPNANADNDDSPTCLLCLANLTRRLERERDEARAEAEKWRKRSRQETLAWIDHMKRADKAEAALERVKALHHDAGESQGYTPEVRGGYGMIPHCCASCGSFGEYGTPWPCETIQAIEGAGDE